MIHALADARYDDKVGVIILTYLGEDAFCPVAIRKFVVTTAVTAMIPVLTT